MQFHGCGQLEQIEDPRGKYMPNPKNVATDEVANNENGAGRSKPSGSSEAAKAADETRSFSEEGHFQNVLEDDEVREALRVLHNSGPGSRKRP